MTYQEAVQIMPEEDYIRASLDAMNTLLQKRGIYTEHEFGQLITGWVGFAYRKEGRLESITASVVKFYDVSEVILRGRSNRPAYVLPRQIAMYLSRALTDKSLNQIGDFFHKHHTTILHSIGVIAARREVDKQVDAFIRQSSSEYAEKWGPLKSGDAL